MKRIILVGAGGHAKTVVETIEKNGDYEIVGFVTPGNIGEEVYHSHRIIGNDDHLAELYNKEIHDAFVCIGFMGLPSVRERLYTKLKAVGFNVPIIIDPSSVVASDVTIGEGSYIGRNVIINADARIGKMCIINSAAVVEHECRIGDFSHVAVSAVICGQTTIGANVFVGANATVIQNVTIGNGSLIGAGSLVRKNIEDKTKVLGPKILKIKESI